MKKSKQKKTDRLRAAIKKALVSQGHQVTPLAKYVIDQQLSCDTCPDCKSSDPYDVGYCGCDWARQRFASSMTAEEQVTYKHK